MHVVSSQESRDCVVVGSECVFVTTSVEPRLACHDVSIFVKPHICVYCRSLQILFFCLVCSEVAHAFEHLRHLACTAVKESTTRWACVHTPKRIQQQSTATTPFRLLRSLNTPRPPCRPLSLSFLLSPLDQTSRAQPEIPTTNTPGGPHSNNNNNDAVVPVTPTNVDGSAWDLACLGGPGWGSPDTSESPAASVWAAIPPLTATDSAADQAPPPPLSSSLSGQTWAVFGGGGAAVVEGGNNGGGRGAYGGGAHSQLYHHQHHQQPRIYNRSINMSTASMFSSSVGGGGGGGYSTSAAAAALNATSNGNGNGIGGDSSAGGAVGLSSLDWELLGDDPAAPVASAAQAAFADGGDSGSAYMGGGGDGGGGSRRASPVYPALAPGAVSGGHL